jgi:hypothetical protein
MASIDISPPRRATWPSRISAPALALPLLVVIGAGFISVLGLFATVPNTFADEAIYIELARHLHASGRFEILGVSFPALTYGPAYVLLLAPIARFAATARDAYMIMRGLNALIFATAIIPAFLIARRVVSRRSAFLVASAAIAIPAAAYTTKIMTESLAYPVVLWSVLTALLVSERSTIQRQIALLLCLVVATAVRFELLVLLPAAVLACVVAAGGQVRTRCQRLMPLLVGTGVVLVSALVVVHASSRSGAGAEAGVHGFSSQEFSILRFGALLLSSLGALDLYSGVLPFASLVFVAVAIRRNAHWVSADLRAIILLTIAGATALLITGSAYLATVPAAARPPIPPDRYSFYVVPLLFVVFAAWIESGAIRDAGTAWVAVGAAALPVIAALVGVSHHPHGTANGLAFVPWLVLSQGSRAFLLAALAAYCGLCAFLLIRKTTALYGLIKPVLILIPVSSICAFLLFLSAGAFSPQPGWLDAHSKPGVIAIWAGEPRPDQSHALWGIDVANRNLSAIYFTRKPDVLGRGMETRVTESADGTLLDNGRPLMARYVLTPVETQVVGTLVAKSNGFAIYRTEPPVRLDHSRRSRR